MIKKIVVPVRGDGKGDNVFAHAAVLAARYKAHIAVAHCRPRVEDMMPYGVPIPQSLRELLITQTSGVADQVEDSMRLELEALAKKYGVQHAEAALPDQASTTWVEEQGRQVDVIKRHGRVADLICVAKPDVDRNLGSNTLKAALFNTGRAVMMCPPVVEPPARLCEHIAIAWNGSIQASRAVAITSGILEQAKHITILSAGIEANGADSNSLRDYFTAHGVNASVERFEAKGNTGQQLLDKCVAVGADSLLMGAYRHSRESETVFGGTTQYIVDHGNLPVILVH